MEPHMFDNYIHKCLCMQYMWVSSSLEFCLSRLPCQDSRFCCLYYYIILILCMFSESPDKLPDGAAGLAKLHIGLHEIIQCIGIAHLRLYKRGVRIENI